MIRLLAAALALLLSPLRALATDAQFVPLAGAAVPVRSMEADGRTYLAVNDVLHALGGSVAYDAATRSYEARIQQHTAVFGTEAPLVVVDTKLVSLVVPVRGDGPTAYADPDFFQKVVGPLVQATLTWDRAARQLVARKIEVPEIIVEASVVSFEETSKVVLKFSQPPSYRVEKSEDQVVLRFPEARLVPATPDKTVDDPRVARVQLRPTEVGIVLKEKGLSSNVYPLGAPPRLVVDVTRAAAPGPAPAPGALARPAAEGKTVVIDPGHGGAEEGAAGPGGLLEKEAMLALARTVKEVLTRRGYKVVLTRESDATIALEERAAAANAASADVFLSLHGNASKSPAAHGTEVYYLSLDASDRAAAALAESENRAQEAGPPSAEANAAMRDLDLILWDLAQNQHLAASERLAEIVQEDFNRLLGITTRGVKQAPFKVLIGVNAPAVLVEVAFISNPDEEKKLGSEEFRRQTAETLAGSLEAFFRRADRIGPGPAAR